MNSFSDEALLGELKQRLAQKKQTLHEQEELMDLLKSTNLKLKESEELKSQFLSNIRNEINNPLAAILGLSKSLLRTDEIDMDNLFYKINLVFQETFLLDFQLRNIFVAAELEAGESSPYETKVDILSLIRDVVESCDHLIKKKTLGINFVAPDHQQVFFITDHAKLQLIISNLLLNAIEFSPENGAVEISVINESRQLRISVTDNGPGIAPEDQAKIFDRFRQLDAGTGKMHAGHGLGLSIIRSLLEIMGGEIMMNSLKEKGSCFTITLNERRNIHDIALPEGDEIFFNDEHF